MLKFILLSVLFAAVSGQDCDTLFADPACQPEGGLSPCSVTCGPGQATQKYICDHGGTLHEETCNRDCNNGVCPAQGDDCAALMADGCTFSARSGCSKTCGIGTMTESWYCPAQPTFVHQCVRRCCLRPCGTPHFPPRGAPKGLCRDAYPAVKIPSNL